MSVGGEFDGAGLLAYGLARAGLRHAWLCEADEWRRSILNLRFPGVHVYPDVRAVDARAPRVDVIAGGFPCKGASTAGKRNGFEHPETVLWREMARTIRELRPRYVLVENVANILAIHDGAVWGEVVGDLATLGFDIEWDCFPAAAFGAPHLRDRVIAIAAHPDRSGWGARERDLRQRQPDAQRRADAAPDTYGAGRPRRRIAEPQECGVDRGGGRQERGTGRDQAATDADRDGRRPQSERVAGRDCAARSGDAGAASAVADDEGCDGREERDREGPRWVGTGHDVERLGVRVEWGEYEAAIRRWETVVGPAPEPLCAFRGVDARPAARVERSRLSALGDGVQLQLGELAGRRLIELEEQRLMRGAA